MTGGGKGGSGPGSGPPVRTMAEPDAVTVCLAMGGSLALGRKINGRRRLASRAVARNDD